MSDFKIACVFPNFDVGCLNPLAAELRVSPKSQDSCHPQLINDLLRFMIRDKDQTSTVANLF